MSTHELTRPEASCCAPNYPMGCVCTSAERAIRAWKEGRMTEPMTIEQRAWCLSQIASVEGYNAANYSDASDVNLAEGTLDAWLDYCRDKGLL